MATNLAIDEKLLAKALKIGGFKTKRETVNEALKEYIQARERLGILELFGTLEWDETFDYKKARQRHPK